MHISRMDSYRYQYLTLMSLIDSKYIYTKQFEH